MRDEELQEKFMKERQEQLALCYTWLGDKPALQGAERHTLTNIGYIPHTVREQIHDFLILPPQKRPCLLFWSHSATDAPKLARIVAAFCNDLRNRDTRCLYAESRDLYDVLLDGRTVWTAGNTQYDLKPMAQYIDVLVLSNVQRLLDPPRKHVPEWASVIDNRLGFNYKPTIFTLIDPAETPSKTLIRCLGAYTAESIARGAVTCIRWQESE